MHLRVAKCCDENVADLSEREVVATAKYCNNKTSESILIIFALL